jgi:D-tyrosyl-tRNA(Tyr) deacylase
LYGKLTKKHQPDYKHAMKTHAAEVMYIEFLDMLKSNYEPNKIKDGVFGAMMDVALVNDGPVTIVIESTPPPPAALNQPETAAEKLVIGEKSTGINSN